MTAARRHSQSIHQGHPRGGPRPSGSLTVASETAGPLNELTKLAAELCNNRTAFISLLGDERQWFKASYGPDRSTDTTVSALCRLAVDSAQPLYEVPDIKHEARQRRIHNFDEPSFRFYAGAPLRPEGERAVGTLSVVGNEPTSLSESQRTGLLRLAVLAESLLTSQLVHSRKDIALRQAEQREQGYRFVADNVADVVIVHCRAGSIRYLSPNASGLLGHHDVEAMESLRLFDLVHRDDRSNLEAALDNLTEDQPTASVAVRLQSATTGWFDASIHIRAVGDSDTAVEYHSAIRDNTEVISNRRKLERVNAHLVEMARQRTSLTMDIAHDLTGPFTAISATATAMASKFTDPSLVGEAENLTSHVRQAEALITKLGRTADPTQDPTDDKTGLDRHLVDLAELVERAVNQLSDSPPVALDLRRVYAEVDFDAVFRIITNLVSNAIEHTPDDTPISVSLTERSDRAVIIVTDEGPGIPVDQRRRVVRPFERYLGDRSVAGSGLGLAIANSLTAAHDGTLAVHANRPSGTQVFVRLPLAAPAGAS